MNNYLITAGGKINCLRCTAHSSRTGEQCARPALKTSRTQKCQFHGARSTGPRSDAGKQRIRDAHWKHGERSAAGVARASKEAARIRQLEDALRVLGAISGPRRRGRHPESYVPINTIAEVEALVRALIQGELGF